MIENFLIISSKNMFCDDVAFLCDLIFIYLTIY